MGGGHVIGQPLDQGLVDELRLHLAPMALGSGTPLFNTGTRQTYRQRDVRPSRNAVHLTYERVQIETSGCDDAPLERRRQGDVLPQPSITADLRLTSAHRTRAQNVGDESRQART
jgi:RibD C-terminal domain